MGDLARTVKRNALRVTWGALSPIMGSSHPNYRQALWSPNKQPIGDTTLRRFGGIEDASSWYRRGWQQLGIVAVQSAAMDMLLKRPGARPAVAFVMKDQLVVGELADPQGFGHLVTPKDGMGNVAHGFRLGPLEPDKTSSFAIGATLPNGSFVTPPSMDVYDMGSVSIDEAFREGSGFAKINFS